MNPCGEIIVLGIVAFLFTVLGFLGGKYECGKNQCQDKGGIYVQGSDGWLCMKGEKL
jgi:hypothetical protein